MTILRKLKNIIVQVLLKIVSRLDRNYSERSGLQYNLGIATTNKICSRHDDVAPQQVFNINQGAYIEDFEKFRWILNQLIARHVIDREELIQKVSSLHHTLLKMDQVLDLIEKVALQKKNNTDWIMELLRLKKISAENSLSYKLPTGGGENPIFWPDPTHAKYPAHLNGANIIAKPQPFITTTTKIISAGSCFAMEIAHHLIKAKFNYLVTEEDTRYELPISSARWGTVFNTPSFAQLVEKSFGLINIPPILWTINDGTIQYRDPFREDVFYHSIEEYNRDYYQHINKSKQALEEAEVMVITLGVNEVWYLKNTEFAFAQSPWNISPLLCDRKVLTVEENLKYLQRMYDVLKIFNKKIKLIVTVSPVPLHATFRSEECHVVVANAHSKAVLRVAAEEFCKKNTDAIYFPAYETVMYTSTEPWEKDLRHVTREAVSNVMRNFEKMFVKNN